VIKRLILFSMLAYGLAWLAFGVAIAAARGAFELPVPEALVLALATVGIALAGVLAAAIEGGMVAVRGLMVQTVRWRVRPAWYLAAVLAPAVVAGCGFLLGLALGNPLPPAPSLTSWLMFPVLLVSVFIAAWFEEIGWRGYALPRLQSRVGELRASLVLGVVWACVHLPLWLLPGFGFEGQSVPLYIVQLTATSVLLAVVYNATGRSVLMTGLTHGAMNAWVIQWNAALLGLPEAGGMPTPVLLTMVAVVLATLVVLVRHRHVLRERSMWAVPQRIGSGNS
jgi:membrane protease YdiL (CAAX protease family)